MVLVHNEHSNKQRSGRSLKLHYLVLCVLLISVVCTPVFAAGWIWDTPTTETWYFQDSDHTVNTVLGYNLKTTESSIERSVDQSWLSNRTIEWSWKISIVNKLGNEVELSSGYVANTSRSTDGSGLQSTTWMPPLTTVYAGYEALRLDLYMRGNGTFGTTYSHMATFISNKLMTTQLANTTWTFYAWTERTYIPVSNFTRGWFKWSSLSYKSRVEGITYRTLSPWEQQQYQLAQGDFMLFLTTPFTYINVVGNLFYGLVVFFFAITTLLRYNDFRPVIVMFWLFGGTGGALTLLIPAVGLHLAWFFLAFALASTLYLVISR